MSFTAHRKPFAFPVPPSFKEGGTGKRGGKMNNEDAKLPRKPMEKSSAVRCRGSQFAIFE
jgi:hypothetical protein